MISSCAILEPTYGIMLSGAGLCCPEIFAGLLLGKADLASRVSKKIPINTRCPKRFMEGSRRLGRNHRLLNDSMMARFAGFMAFVEVHAYACLTSLSISYFKTLALRFTMTSC